MSVEPEQSDDPQGAPGDPPPEHVESSIAAAPEYATIIVKLVPGQGPSSGSLAPDDIGLSPEVPLTSEEKQEQRARRREVKAKAVAEASMPKALGRY